MSVRLRREPARPKRPNREVCLLQSAGRDNKSDHYEWSHQHHMAVMSPQCTKHILSKHNHTHLCAHTCIIRMVGTARSAWNIYNMIITFIQLMHLMLTTSNSWNHLHKRLNIKWRNSLHPAVRHSVKISNNNNDNSKGSWASVSRSYWVSIAAPSH